MRLRPRFYLFGRHRAEVPIPDGMGLQARVCGLFLVPTIVQTPRRGSTNKTSRSYQWWGTEEMSPEPDKTQPVSCLRMSPMASRPLHSSQSHRFDQPTDMKSFACPSSTILGLGVLVALLGTYHSRFLLRFLGGCTCLYMPGPRCARYICGEAPVNDVVEVKDTERTDS